MHLPSARGNMEEMEERIDTAALDKPDIILLTEGCMHNTPRPRLGEEKDARSEPLPDYGPITTFLARKAKEHRAYIIGSYWRKDDARPGPVQQRRPARPRGQAGRLLRQNVPHHRGDGERRAARPRRRGVRHRLRPHRRADLLRSELSRNCSPSTRSKALNCSVFSPAFRGGFHGALGRVCEPVLHRQRRAQENGEIVDPLGRVWPNRASTGGSSSPKSTSTARSSTSTSTPSVLDGLKEKYGPHVNVETASPEAVYFLSSLHPDRAIDEMIEEFEIETLDEYLIGPVTCGKSTCQRGQSGRWRQPGWNIESQRRSSCQATRRRIEDRDGRSWALLVPERRR